MEVHGGDAATMPSIEFRFTSTEVFFVKQKGTPTTLPAK
jgi:hypothetical protein